VPPPAGNLPTADVPMFGRVADNVALQRLLGEHRLVTVVGASGIGKTRLALAVAQNARARFADGAWLVELAPLADAALVARTVASTLGFAAGAQFATIDGVARALVPLSVLLVLDNCEHVIGTVRPLVEAILAQATGAVVLATTQEPLHLAGEQVYRMEALALPPESHEGDPLEYGAVALFAERVRAVQSQFAVGAGNRAAVVEICRRLDGIPLALELAAARVPLLGVAGVRARLDERFRLLRRSSGAAPSRHQTLHDALDWTHGLLSEPARAVLRRVGVFAGSFALDAAQEVASDATLDEWAVLDDLGELVDKSMVLVGRDAVPRYRLLESTRAYALEALARAGEATTTRRRHARVIAESFRSADDRYLTEPVHGWQGRLAPDLDNWREALAFSLSSDGEPGVAVALVASAAAFLVTAGLADECARALERAQPFAPAADPSWQGRLHLAQAVLRTVHHAVSLPTARRAAEAAASVFRETGDAVRLYRVLNLSSQYAELAGDLDATRTADAEMLSIEQAGWPALLRRLSRLCAARRLRREGRLAESRDAFDTEARRCAAAGDDRTAWNLFPFVAMTEVALGRLDRALAVMQPIVAQIRAQGAQRQFWRQMAMHAQFLIEAGDLGAARPAVREAIALLLSQGQLWWFGDHLALLAASRGDLARAARLHGWAEARTEEQGVGRGPVIKEARDRLRAQLEGALPTGELATILVEAKRLTDAEAAALAALDLD
jgi:predicted ATPase